MQEVANLNYDIWLLSYLNYCNPPHLNYPVQEGIPLRLDIIS